MKNLIFTLMISLLTVVSYAQEIETAPLAGDNIAFTRVIKTTVASTGQSLALVEFRITAANKWDGKKIQFTIFPHIIQYGNDQFRIPSLSRPNADFTPYNLYHCFIMDLPDSRTGVYAIWLPALSTDAISKTSSWSGPITLKTGGDYKSGGFLGLFPSYKVRKFRMTTNITFTETKI